MKPELERLTEAVRKAEAELDAATTRTALNTAAKRLMMARAELKRLQGEPRGRRRQTRYEIGRPSVMGRGAQVRRVVR